MRLGTFAMFSRIFIGTARAVSISPSEIPDRSCQSTSASLAP
jgi:hypothetical protein